MDFDVLEKLLNHLERCQFENKPLEVNIDEDLLKIFPLPRKLILDLLSERLILTLFRFIEKDQCQILSCLSLGYCRVGNPARGKEIEKSLYSILPILLNTDVLKILDNLQLIKLLVLFSNRK
jgi:hypothetical protein